MTTPYIESFWTEAHLPGQVHHQKLSDAINAILGYYKPWGLGKVEQIVLTPRYGLMMD